MLSLSVGVPPVINRIVPAVPTVLVLKSPPSVYKCALATSLLSFNSMRPFFNPPILKELYDAFEYGALVPIPTLPPLVVPELIRTSLFELFNRIFARFA